MGSERGEYDRGRSVDRPAEPQTRRSERTSGAERRSPVREALRQLRFTSTLSSALLEARAIEQKNTPDTTRSATGTPRQTLPPAAEQAQPASSEEEYIRQPLLFTVDIPGIDPQLDLDKPFCTAAIPSSPGGSSVSSCETQIAVASMATSGAQHGNSGVSPSSSPRLPSPPPFTEVQIGPKSPLVSGAVSEFSLDSKPDEGASRRIRPGTRSAEMVKGPPFVPLHQLESAFQLQEYLQSLLAKLTCDNDSKTIKPVDKEMALELATPPTAQDTGEAVDRNLWLYELCRLLCQKTSRLIVAFFLDTPACSSQTCPEMRASEWQYLCAVHEPPKSCCAIDYCNHTLDWASNILSSNKHFPSRLSLGGEGGNAYQSMRQLTNIFRRVYRIYAHAWFQHRDVFWAIEAEYGLYMLFKTVCDQYQLIPEDNYTIPPEAEGEREPLDAKQSSQASPDKSSNVSILRKGDSQAEEPNASQASNIVSTGATTRRHKHTPSTGVPVAMIAEGQEEDDEDEGEATMLDMGGPGPAHEAESSLSPPQLRFARSKSPGLIDIPLNMDPERAPEDPTPIAIHESNPFGSPGPSVITETSPGSGHAAAQAASSKLEQVLNPSAEAAGSPATEEPLTAIETKKLGAALGHFEETGNTAATDSDNETQVLADSIERDDATAEADESIEVINADEVRHAAQEVETTKLEQSADTETKSTAPATEEKS